MDEFTRQYLEMRPTLARLVRRILRYHPPEEIEDVLQDVWVKGSQAHARQAVTHFKAWVGRTAINLAINRIRRFRKELKREEYRRHAETCLIPAPPSADELVLRHQARAALEALSGSIPKQVAAARIVYLEGRTYAEAASALDVEEGTVKSNAHKAIARLRTTLADPKAA